MINEKEKMKKNNKKIIGLSIIMVFLGLLNSGMVQAQPTTVGQWAAGSVVLINGHKFVKLNDPGADGVFMAMEAICYIADNESVVIEQTGEGTDENGFQLSVSNATGIGPSCSWSASTSEGPVTPNWTTVPDSNGRETGCTIRVPSLSKDTTFTPTVNNCNISGALSKNHIVTLIFVPNLTPEQENIARCGSGDVVLSATPGQGGNALRFYTTPTGGTPLTTINQGSTYTHPNVANNTILYVSSYNIDSTVESKSRVPINITINQVPAAPTLSADTASVCEQATITSTTLPNTTAYFQGTSNSTYEQALTSPQTVTSDGTYYFRNHSIDGCWSDPSSVTIALESCAPLVMNFSELTDEHIATMPNCTTTECPTKAVLELVDDRDGKTYTVRKLPDGKLWMVDNLAYGGTSGTACDKASFLGTGSYSFSYRFGSYTFGDCREYPSNPEYGFLYSWQAAMQEKYAYYNSSYTGPQTDVTGLCPEGFVLPTGGTTGDFKSLQDITGWSASQWSNPHLFNAVYSGWCTYTGGINNLGERSEFWTSTSYDNQNAAVFFKSTSSVMPTVGLNKNSGVPIRCVR